MNADGSNVRRITFPDAGADSTGGWHPDGSQLVFQSTRDGNFEVYKINVDGTGETRLTNNPGRGLAAHVVARRHQDRLQQQA